MQIFYCSFFLGKFERKNQGKLIWLFYLKCRYKLVKNIRVANLHDVAKTLAQNT